MFPNTTSGLSFGKILSGLSKSLNIVQEIIPIYEQAKPMISGARKAITSLSGLSRPKDTTQSNTITNKKTTTLSNSLVNNPTFFK